ncbi:hypothetical protein [Puerhibacterium sp. TATVAM-FAB25]|uniref:hypothetical protein n=1 Tax=Puerhibacterium sp. TATVAM-FAB25 TaxID=3093699 RepID=UPI00397E7D19
MRTVARGSAARVAALAARRGRPDLRLTTLLRCARVLAGGRTGAGGPPGVLPAPDAAPVAAALAEAVARLPADRREVARRAVLDPLGRGGGPGVVGAPRRLALPSLDPAGDARPAPARQVDETTCGSAVLALLAMAGDPALALRVARGAPARAFGALQLRAHRATSRGGAVPWPQALGTPPWAAARVARCGAVRYTHAVVDVADVPCAAPDPVLDAALAAARAGVPVPLFTGGDLRGGWRAAVPRHVVLLVAVDAAPGPDGGAHGADEAATARLYEPSSATVHTVPLAALRRPGDAAPHERAALTAALGGWPHVAWALLPRTR